MAIFIASTKSISRGNGQSAVASASYRAGVELEDKRYDKTHDYSKRHGVMSADIILPSALAAANTAIDRNDLWNKAEGAEKRKDARVAREWLVNLPHELNEQDRKAIAHQFAQTLADRYGTIADCAIHKPTGKEIERGADPRNFHAHIMFTTRTADFDDNNEIILADKTTIELSDTKRGKLGMARVSHEIKDVRQIWEQIANDKLAEHNHELIDSRSYAEQGIDIMPQVKMGVDATHMERRTGETSIRGDVNRLIAERNELVWRAELENNKRINDKADQIIFDSRKNNERELAMTDLEQELQEQTQLVHTQQKTLLGQIKELHQSTSELATTNQELKESIKTLDSSNKQLLSANKDFRTQNKQLSDQLERANKQIISMSELLDTTQAALEKQQPLAPSMTTHDEQELLDLIDSKNELIESLEQTNMQMRDSLSLLNV